MPMLKDLNELSPEGFKGQCYHIHMASLSHAGLWDRIYLRDYLIANTTVAKEYGALKLELAMKFKNDRDAYTAGKSEFIQKVMTTIKSTNHEK